MLSSMTSRAGLPLAATTRLLRWLLYAASVLAMVTLAVAVSAAAVGREAPAPIEERIVPSSKAFRADPALATARRLLRRLLYTALVLMLVALAGALVTAAAARAFGYGTLVVNGSSMGGTAPTGSLIIARWVAAEDVEMGDVIVVQEESADGQERSKIHRVVSLEEEGDQILAQTKGDANNDVDPDLYILPDRVLTSAYTLPYLGYLVHFVATPLGWALLVALPATAFCLFALRSIWTDKERPAAKPRTV